MRTRPPRETGWPFFVSTDQTQHWALHRAVNPAPFGARGFDSLLIHQETQQMTIKTNGSVYNHGIVVQR